MKTLAAFLDEFLKHSRALNVSRHTLRSYRYNVRRFLGWLEQAHGVGIPGQLRRKHLDAWIEHLAAHRTTRGLPLKPGSVNAINDKVRGFLKYLASRGHLPRSLASAVEYVKAPTRLPGSVLTHAQMQRLLARVDTSTAGGYRDRATLELLYTTGIRAAELLGLNLGDIDWDRAVATVTGKGDKQRVVPVGRTALRYLRSYVTAVRPFLARDSAEQALFLTAQGRRMPYHRFLQSVHRYAAAAGFDPAVMRITPHTFRRSCTTELLRSEANMYHVKELLGHESLETLRHYARLTITDLKKTHRKCHPREKDDCP